MPTEHEFKYVLSLDLSEKAVKNQASQVKVIEQGCICHGPGMYLRIRKAVSKNRPEWYMTFKLKDADRTIEIEQKIDDRDGEDLWGRCYWKLQKDRYIVEDRNLKWEIDFFKNAGKVYFILAEAELPESAPRPKEIASVLRDHLLHEVSLTDDRFSNKRLGDVSYAIKLYQHVVSQKGKAIK